MSNYYDPYSYGAPSVPGVVVTPGSPPAGGAAINMPYRQQMGGQGDLPPFMRVPVWPPQILLSTNRAVGHQTRDYGAGILNIAANTPAVTSIQFDIPVIIFALTASVTTTDNSALPVGKDPLSLFTIQLQHSNGEQLTAGGARLGQAIVGTAERPRLVGGNGYVFNQGSSLIMEITPFIANLRIDVVCQVIEERGPTNLTGR